MVLAEALAAGVPVLASTSGAITEVAGDAAAYHSPGDWIGLAERLATTLSAPPRPPLPHERIRYSAAAAAARLASAYEEVLDGRGTQDARRRSASGAAGL